MNIAFIFDRCRHSSAAVAPVKYKCDSNNLRGTFARTKILLTEKLTNGASVTPITINILRLGNMYASVNWFIIGLDNGVLPFGAKPLSIPILTCQWEDQLICIVQNFLQNSFAVNWLRCYDNGNNGLRVSCMVLPHNGKFIGFLCHDSLRFNA